MAYKTVTAIALAVAITIPTIAQATTLEDGKIIVAGCVGQVRASGVDPNFDAYIANGSTYSFGSRRGHFSFDKCARLNGWAIDDGKVTP
jgi:hypothetical protein